MVALTQFFSAHYAWFSRGRSHIGKFFTEVPLTTGAAIADSETMAQNCGEYDCQD